MSEDIRMLRRRLSVLENKVKIEVLRVSVMTEVLRLRPDLASRFVAAASNMDDWWRKKSSFTIEGWIQVLEKHPDIGERGSHARGESEMMNYCRASLFRHRRGGA